MDKSLWAASCFLIVAGMLFLIGGFACWLYQNYKEPFEGKTTARVVDLLLQEPKIRRQPMLYKNYYYPVLEYYAEGKLYKVTHPEGSYPSAFRANQEVPICYNQTDPLEYKIADNSKIKILAQALYVIGVLGIAVGCIIFLIFARRG